MNKLEQLEQWAMEISDYLADDKSNDWSEELEQLAKILDGAPSENRNRD